MRASNPKLARIDVSKPGFLARRDLPPVVLPPQHVPQQVAALREESASSRHSLDVEIDQFHFGEEERASERPVELLDSETESDRFSTVHHPSLIVARPNTSSEERESIDLKDGLKGSDGQQEQGTNFQRSP